MAEVLPRLCTVTKYSIVSPGDGTPSPSASPSVARAAVFSATSTGAAVMAVTVTSAVPPRAGSSVRTVGSSWLATMPWLRTSRTPAGSGLSILTSNRTVAEAPAERLPRLTFTGLSVSIVPCVDVTEPAITAAWAGVGSSSTTPVARPLPRFSITIS